jgi:hypothetical protein
VAPSATMKEKLPEGEAVGRGLSRLVAMFALLMGDEDCHVIRILQALVGRLAGSFDSHRRRALAAAETA